MSYKRVLLKLSGEALLGEKSYGVDPKRILAYSEEIKEIVDSGVEIAIVIGGGNIFRGIKGASEGIDRSTSDYMGMLATVMNALSLQSSLEKIGVPTRVQSAITMSQIAEPYIRRRAIRHLEKNRIVIFAAGTGNPFFTTDSAAALRANELGSEILLKGTKVDGVYDKDPHKYIDAEKYNELSYNKVIKDDLRVMDMTAITLCHENNIPIKVFNIKSSGDLIDIISGSNIGTTIGR